MSTPTREEPRSLDGFETALLAELRSVVAESPAGQAPNPLRRKQIRWIAAWAAVAATTTAIIVLPSGTSPAYAVSKDSAGSLTVEINRLADADALVRDLKALGVNADVTYTPAGQQCAPGRFTPAQPGAGTSTLQLPRSASAEATSGASGATRWSITLPKGYVTSGQTLVIETTWPDDRSWMLNIGVAQGAVGPCRLVAAEPMTPPSGASVTGPPVTDGSTVTHVTPAEGTATAGGHAS